MECKWLPLNTRVELEDNSPFKRYRETNYKISIGDYQQSVYQDEYGNFFVQSNKYSGNTGIYLTKDEVENAMYMQWCEFPDTWWFSNVIGPSKCRWSNDNLYGWKYRTD